MLDTRVDATAIAPRGTRLLNVLGPASTPTHLHGVQAVVATIIVVNPSTSGHLTVRRPTDSGSPTTSSMNFVGGTTTSNTVVAAVDDDGNIGLYNGSAGSSDVAVDITGYVTR